MTDFGSAPAITMSLFGVVYPVNSLAQRATQGVTWYTL